MVKLLQFTADWCQPCKSMKPILEELDKEKPGVLQRVDIEDEKNADLVSKYGVMSIPTFITLEDGEEKKRVVGAQTKQTLLELVG